VKPKDQGFDKVAEKMYTSNTINGIGGLYISFGKMFQTKYKVIMILIIIVVVTIAAIVLIIFLYYYCNKGLGQFNLNIC
jgi:hypothetical protein